MIFTLEMKGLFFMKNVILGLVLALVATPVFAGSCPCETKAVVKKTVTVTEKVVAVPVRAVASVRSRLAARRAARLEARAEIAECVAGCSACACEGAVEEAK